MKHNADVTHEAKLGVELSQERLRLELADEILARLMREDRDHAFVDTRELVNATMDDLLGDFWLAYGWREKRRLARAVDWRLALVREALQGVGHALPQLAPGLLEVDAGACIATKEALERERRARADARERAAWRRDNLVRVPVSSRAAPRR